MGFQVLSADRIVDHNDVWRRLRQGDPAAGAMLYDTFRNTVEGLVWRLLGGDPECADVVQRAFFQILRGAKGVRSGQALPLWVKTVTTNTVRDELKRRRAERRLRQSTVHEQAFEQNREAGERTNSQALLRRVCRILETLEVDDRLAFHLRYVEEHTLEEAAVLSRCSLATVKRRLARAEQTVASLARNDMLLSEWMNSIREGVA